MTPPIRTRPDGTRYPITPRRGGAGALVAIGIALALASGSLTASGIGFAGATGGSLAADLPGNLAGDVTDGLPGRDLSTRRAEARRSARQGRSQEAWSRLRLKQLTRRIEHQVTQKLDCVAASTGRVREFLLQTPCTSLDRMLLTVGDGHGNAAVVSIVRVGFRTTAQAQAFQRVEDMPGSGDVRPLDTAAFLKITGVSLTAEHYHSRLDGSAVVVAEADTATGHLDGQLLDAIADTASYLPLR